MDFLVAVEQYRSCTIGNVRVNVARMIFRSYFKRTQPEEAAAVSSSIEEAMPTKSEQYKIWLNLLFRPGRQHMFRCQLEDNGSKPSSSGQMDLTDSDKKYSLLAALSPGGQGGRRGGYRG